MVTLFLSLNKLYLDIYCFGFLIFIIFGHHILLHTE